MSHFKNLTKRLEWLDELGDTDVWMDGVAAGKVTDFAGEADASDASELRDFVPVKRIALVAALTHKARMRVRDDLATKFCKRVEMKIKKAKAELEEIRLAEREIVEALIGNYRTVLKHIDEGGPAQEALAKAAAVTAEVRQTLEGLDEEASVDEVAARLEGRVSPVALALVKAQVVQAGGFGAVTRAVDGFGGFAKQYEQIGRDRAVMFDLADNDNTPTGPSNCWPGRSSRRRWVLPGGGRPCRAGRECRVQRQVLPPATGGQAARCRLGGGRRVPGERWLGDRSGDGHPVAEGVPG